MTVLEADNTPPHLHIRSATVADIPGMMALEKLAASAAHWSTEQYQAAFLREGPSRMVLIVAEESKVQGFIVGKVSDDEWEIENLAIAGPERRRGLGRQLVGGFLNRARAANAKSVFLEVRESNLAARRLYEKSAFIEAGRRTRYYREPNEDAIVYRLELS
jgi:[ribosomal protein S18]-alanine N-acetyltransferase